MVTVKEQKPGWQKYPKDIIQIIKKSLNNKKNPKNQWPKIRNFLQQKMQKEAE